jgi:hypothetical protein
MYADISSKRKDTLFINVAAMVVQECVTFPTIMIVANKLQLHMVMCRIVLR